MARDGQQTGFFGWRVVRAAFVVAVFGWGVGFYGPPVFLHAVQAERGWGVATVSGAVTLHFLSGAAVVAGLAGLHARFGLAAVTRAGAVLAAVGVLGWALAAAPWQLLLATLASGAGWAMTGAAAINAMVAPWFARRRPVALAAAYNGASIGGVVFSPLWVALIAALGFPGAAGLVGLVTIGVVWWLAGRVLGATPAGLGLLPDGDAAGAVPAAPSRHAAPLAGTVWRDRRFVTLALGAALGLFAQIGLIAHLLSLLVPALGAGGAGLAMGMATALAIAGRTGMGWVLGRGGDRRRALALSYLVQMLGCGLLLAAGGTAPAPLLAGVALFGLGIGNATSLPPLIAQADFGAAEVARVVALVTAVGQAGYAFAPLAFGLLREVAPDGAAVFVAAAAIQLAAAAVIMIKRARVSSIETDGHT
jgi:hypothetical protein